jgi:hypothetical protein
MADHRPGRAPDLEDLVHDPVGMAQSIARRDRWLLWLLAGLAVALWALAAGGALALVYFHFLHIVPRLEAMVRHPDRFRGPADMAEWITASQWAAGLVAATAVLALLAAVCTVGLVLVAWRVARRQLRAGMAEVAEELRQLRGWPPDPPPPAK